MIVRSILPRTTPRSFPRITARDSTQLAYPLTRSTSSRRLRPLSRTCERAVTHVYLLANATDSGCILSVLEQASGRTPDTVFGKPNPLLLGRVTAQYRPDQMVVVGDRLYTDRTMARNVGCDFICVLSGKTTRERIDELSEDEFPSLIVRDLRGLLT